MGPVLDALLEVSPFVFKDVIREGNFMKELKELKLKVRLGRLGKLSSKLG